MTGVGCVNVKILDTFGRKFQLSSFFMNKHLFPIMILHIFVANNKNVIMKKTILFVLLALMGLCQATAQREDYLPIVREGVQWVNEKVIVNNGDTTRFYYKYEFSGDDSTMHINKALYYYTGDYLDVENDSLIAGLLEGYYGDFVTCFRNNALNKSWKDGRKMLRFNGLYDGGTTLLYLLGNHQCDDYYLTMADPGPSSGEEAFLTSDNFMEIDPITIEGIECERYAYIGEDGDTLAYVVEGIGFDSRELGDLLTPFTRKPDPTAEYQEWWGLSHVVKDGKIIYKGMCYRKMESDNIDEILPDRPRDPNYYDMMGRCWGTEVPTTPGIYIHQGQKIYICLTFSAP